MHCAERYGLFLGSSVLKILFFVTLGLTSSAIYADGAEGGNLKTAPRFRGFNLGAVSHPSLAEEDYGDISRYGANLVRIAVKAERCDGCENFSIAADEWEYMENAVGMGRKYGFKVILVLTPMPEGQESVYWDRPELKKSLITIWAKVAAKFKGNPVIAGFDLINEPVQPKDRNVPVGTTEYWRPLAIAMIQAIRAVDPLVTIIFEPSPYALPAGFWPSGVPLAPLPFPRIVYSFHFYIPYEVTCQGLPGYPGTHSYPSGDYTKALLSNYLEYIRLFTRAHELPIYVGEFSIVRWAPGDSVKQYLGDVIDLIETEGWDWTYHSFREYEGWDPELTQSLPRGARGTRSASSKTIRLLVEKGFGKNLPLAVIQ